MQVPKLNVKDNAAKMLDSRLQGNFLSKNVANLSRRNLTYFEISLLSKGHSFVPTSTTIDKSKLKKELEALGGILSYDYSGILEMKKMNLIWINLSQNLLSTCVI